MVDKDFKPGDKVRWNTPQGETRGEVVRKETKTTRAGGHLARPDKAHPEYRVRSDRTGGEAIHRPEALRRD
ncbi:DUF2945 domain-containing protein [Caulobacter sp. 17J80-11]|uniref:DUF2945 domain-containing protein n=1 Tax=Caulobacter sp. 17J80-11 TaxID=2763502 RepID=UPI001653E51D|nr:DUF2945 domain-containing protein [Caulobacter sp. 17J80-11]MBC6982354.1 DUF2945 domain-containing protein [Caulobacter sp. 17J80-11]